MRAFGKHPDLIPSVLTHMHSVLPDYHFAEDLTGWNYPEEWVTIQPSGGTIARIRTGSAQLDVSTYAKTKPEAFNIAMDTVKAFMEMLNFAATDFVVTNVECSYPADISDPLSGNPRWVFDVTMTYRTR